MAEPLTWQIVTTVRDLLQGIDGGAGWHTDIGTHAIHLDRTQTPDTDAAFTVIVCDEITTDESATGRASLSVSSDIALIVECAIPATAENPELVAHRARADIVRALSGSLRQRVAGLRDVAIESTRITDAVLDGTGLVIAQVLVRASATERFDLPA